MPKVGTTIGKPSANGTGYDAGMIPSPEKGSVFDRRKNLWKLHIGDVVDVLRRIPPDSIDCVCTSPPYYGLRSYLPQGHPDKAKEIGAEKTPAEYVENLVTVFREVRRVLKPTGTLWLNLGDSFASGGRTYRAPDGKDGKNGRVTEDYRPTDAPGIKPKDLLGVPWMVAFALRDDGWYWRQRCPWLKRSSMPESVTDRPGTACEEIMLFSKRSDYFFDMEAVKRRSSDNPVSAGRRQRTDNGSVGTDGLRGQLNGQSGKGINAEHKGDTRNFRNADLWFDSVGMMLSDDGDLLGFDVTTKPYKGAHFAVWPMDLVRPMILAGTSAKGCCPKCGAPWERVVEKRRKATRPGADTKVTGDSNVDGNRDPERHVTRSETVGWSPTCSCGGEPVPAVVLDPFAGSGTTLLVATQLGRRAVGIDIDERSVALVADRVGSPYWR